MEKEILPSELPVNADGAIYHLNLHYEDIADNVILVGDPARVELLSSMFDTVELRKKNRELITHTGIYCGKRISVISTGMGTDNIDIVVNELDAVANIDLSTRKPRPEHRKLNIVRIGTSGALQPDVEVGEFVASAWGLGIDGVMQYYDYNHLSNEAFVKAFVEHTGWNERLSYPYCIPASQKLLSKIAFDMRQGVTASAPGFYGPQGREVRAKLMFPDLIRKIESFQYEELRITNMEMECSAIFGLGTMLGHEPLTVCLIIANRLTGNFLNNYQDRMKILCKTVLDRI